MDTTRLIWALGTSDEIEYHTSSSRGTKSVNLLGAPMPEVDLTKYVLIHIFAYYLGKKLQN